MIHVNKFVMYKTTVCDTMEKDIKCIKDALEFYIIMEEERLIETNAGDVEWNELIPYQTALKHISYMESIYG